MSNDITGKELNIGDIIVAPFGKSLSGVCEVIKVRAKTCLVVVTDSPSKSLIGKEFSKHSDSIVIINSISNKLDELGL